MPVNPQRNLADALRRSQAASPDHILRFSQLSRADRELLVRRGFLFEIIKGWYALMTPQAPLKEPASNPMHGMGS